MTDALLRGANNAMTEGEWRRQVFGGGPIVASEASPDRLPVSLEQGPLGLRQTLPGNNAASEASPDRHPVSIEQGLPGKITSEASPGRHPVWDRWCTRYRPVVGYGYGASTIMTEDDGDDEMFAASVLGHRAALLQSLEAPASTLLGMHDAPARDAAAERPKRACSSGIRHSFPADPMEAIVIDAETCDLVLKGEAEGEMALGADGKEDFAEPRTPSRTPQGAGMDVDEELLSCFLGVQASSYLAERAQSRARPAAAAAEDSARTQKLAAVAMTFGGSFAAAAAAKQIVGRPACDSCGGFGARCLDCPDRSPNVFESYIEYPDRERPEYCTSSLDGKIAAQSLRRISRQQQDELNIPTKCCLPAARPW